MLPGMPDLLFSSSRTLSSWGEWSSDSSWVSFRWLLHSAREHSDRSKKYHKYQSSASSALRYLRADNQHGPCNIQKNMWQVSVRTLTSDMRISAFLYLMPSRLGRGIPSCSAPEMSKQKPGLKLPWAVEDIGNALVTSPLFSCSFFAKKENSSRWIILLFRWHIFQSKYRSNAQQLDWAFCVFCDQQT